MRRRTASPRAFLSPSTHRSTSFSTPSTIHHSDLNHSVPSPTRSTTQRRRPSASSSIPSISVYTEDGESNNDRGPRADRAGSFSHPRQRRDSMSAYSEDWEEEYQGQQGQGEESGAGMFSRSKTKKNEPMSPLTVVFYVVFFYIIWQILTRSDDHEILAHLSPSSPLHSGQSYNMDRSHSAASVPYHLPYHLPHLPSPMSVAPDSSSASSSTFRIVIATLLYPVYLLITLVAIPLPFLLNGIHLIASILSTVLYPVTSTTRLLTKTFLLTPLTLVKNALASLYPIYVFVGGVVGVGCVMGIGAGWVCQLGLDLLLGFKSKVKKRRRPSRSRSSSNKKRASYPSNHSESSSQHQVHVHLHEPIPVKIHRAADNLEAMLTPVRPKSKSPNLTNRTSTNGGNCHWPQRKRLNSSDSSATEVPFTPTTSAPAHMFDSVSKNPTNQGKMSMKTGETPSSTSTREPHVLGIRRRGVRT